MRQPAYTQVVMDSTDALFAGNAGNASCSYGRSAMAATCFGYCLLEESALMPNGVGWGYFRLW